MKLIDKPPKKTITTYAVFRVDEKGLHSCYVDTDTIIPMGVWISAEELPFGYSVEQDNRTDRYIQGLTGSKKPNRKGKWLYYRCGKHCATVPNFKQMECKGGMPHDKLVFEVSIGADIDLTEYMLSVAPRTKSGKIDYKHAGLPHLPKTDVEGFYYYKTNTMAKGEWVIASCYKVERQLTYEEIVHLNNENGLEPQVWIGGYMEIKERWEKDEIDVRDLKKGKGKTLEEILCEQGINLETENQ